MSLSVSDFGGKQMVAFGVLSVSAETENFTFGRSLLVPETSSCSHHFPPLQ